MKSISIVMLLLVAVGCAAASIELSTMPQQEVELMVRMGVGEKYLMEKGWLINKIKDVISGIKDRFRDFRSWLEDRFSDVLEASRPHAEIMRQFALEFIKAMTKSAIESILERGYEYFREQQSEIGEELWNLIDQLYQRWVQDKLQPAGQIADFSMEKFDRLAMSGCSTKYLLTEGLFLQSIGNVINSINSWFNPFKNWIAEQMKGLLQQVQPQVDTLREMAIVFAKEMAKVAAEAVIEAGYEFFRQNQNDIGTAIWELVEQAYRKYLEGKLQYLN